MYKQRIIDVEKQEKATFTRLVLSTISTHGGISPVAEKFNDSLDERLAALIAKKEECSIVKLFHFSGRD